jgi:CBS domain-containing protein
MSSPALTVAASAPLDEVAKVMEERHVHRLVVVADDERTPIGIISTSDLVRSMADGEADA